MTDSKTSAEKAAENIPDGMDAVTKQANAAANKFADSTEHIALNADTEDGETIVRNMRFMAYGIGWNDGYQAGRASLLADAEPEAAKYPESSVRVFMRFLRALAAPEKKEGETKTP